MLNVIAPCHSAEKLSSFSPPAASGASPPSDRLLLLRLHTAGAVKPLLSHQQSQGISHLTNSAFSYSSAPARISHIFSIPGKSSLNNCCDDYFPFRSRTPRKR